MSYPIFSASIPLSLVKSGFHKTPRFSSLVQKSASGRRTALSMMPYPSWDFEVDLNYISTAARDEFMGLYIATLGGAGFFLFTDPTDSAVTQGTGVLLNVTPGAANPMGQTGDGMSTQFQLARTIGGSVDLLQNVSGVSAFAAGVSATGTVGPTGIVTFSSAPAAGAALTWQGSFQYLCQFKDDTLKDLAIVSKNSAGWLWQCGSLQFESVFV